MTTPKPKRRVRRTTRVVQSLEVELRVQLHPAKKQAGSVVIDRRQTAKTVAEDCIVAGDHMLGAQKMTVVVERDDDGHLVAVVAYRDREDPR